jgi:CubicO group peptidase (beta-lactamase class C family)
MKPSLSLPRRSFLALGLTGVAHGGAESAAPRAERFVDALVTAQRIPGLALAVMREGQPVFTRCWGNARPSEPSAIDADTRFCIGSLSKPFLAQLVLMLAQDGRLRLDDPIERHLGPLPPHWRAITLRQLLNHTSGLRSLGDPTQPDDMMADPALRRQIQARRGAPFSEAEQLAVMQGFALHAPPGQGFLYSNAGYNVLGMLLGRIAGGSYRELMRQRIFEPAGMASARFMAADTGFADMAAPCQLQADGRVVEVSDQLPPFLKAFYADGCGGIQLSLRDLVHWDAGLSGRATDSGFSRHLAALPQLWARPVPMDKGLGEDGQPLRYGLGWIVSRSAWGARKVGHGGFIPGYRSSYARYLGAPSWSVAVLCNDTIVDPDPIASTVAGLFARAPS